MDNGYDPDADPYNPMAGAFVGCLVELPWPHPSLSPNARVDRRSVAPIRKKYRADCYLLTKQARAVLKPGRHQLDIKFFPPDARLRDRDNCLASIKSALDGMADALGINDREFDPIRISMGKKRERGMVRVLITPYEGNNDE